jgi:hypothetical protein
MFDMQKCSRKVFDMVSQTLYVTLHAENPLSLVVFPSAHSCSNVLFARMVVTRSAIGDITWGVRWLISQPPYRREGVR